MLARLLQTITLSLVALAVGWLVLWWQRGSPGVAVAGALVLLGGHAIFLGLEMVLVHRVHGDDPAPRATVVQLIKAWWAEVWTAPLVFCWRQPFRWRAEPDHLPADAAGRRGVLLVHGFVCNRGLWNPWMRELRRRGVPFVAVNLEPVFGSIERYVPVIERGWQQLLQATGQPPVVVGHSMGGLAIRQWWRSARPSPPPHHVITIGSPHGGTWLGRFGQTPNARQMRHGCEWIRTLAADESAEHAARFTCFYSHCDNVVFPASTATLPGADNRHIDGQSHVHLAYHPAVFDEVLRRVGEPADPAPRR